MARYFEKISFEQFKKDVGDDRAFYESFSLPKRSTKYSAGYDFESLIDYTLKPGESIQIPLGVKAKFNEDEMLMLVNRSGLGFKYNIRLVNQIGIIESDYYNNETNEGHMSLKIQNEGDKDFVITKKMRILQGIFVKFLTVDDEDEITSKRTGGIGSTGEK